MAKGDSDYIFVYKDLFSKFQKFKKIKDKLKIFKKIKKIEVISEN